MTPDSAAVAAIGRDVVKALEWRVSRYGQLADTLLGLYRIDDDAPRFYVQGSGFSKNCGSYDEAKAAAQADYASRILSALDPAFIARIEALEVENQWRDIETAPKETHVIVVSKRFPEPHDAFLYSDGWFCFGVSGPYRDDPYIWRHMPSFPARTTQEATNPDDGDRQGDE